MCVQYTSETIWLNKFSDIRIINLQKEWYNSNKIIVWEMKQMKLKWENML